ncbi:hypothetical protein IOC61_00170 [Halomonas sp. KAO]|uniref:hypothetical protein n=1 Tax=Halomonas sp. KAO TaxID=2783858 RepID=UPI0018A06681|nr:hypothetical protein [Halomonas sp. KAO]MBF7051744.1 hypothetical protein [Halomonas sp. KAO]
MSLEQTIADLVAASNNLTGTINSKMNEIDQKVDEATDAVPSTIRALSKQVFYVDAEYGSDNAEGTSQDPIKTISEVGKRAVNGSSISINLRSGQIHEVNGFGFTVETGMIGFYAWGSTTGVGLPEIKFTPKYVESEGRFLGYVAGISTGNILVRFCKLTTSFDSSLGEIYSGTSFFAYTNSAISVVIYRSEISLKNAPLISVYSGYAGRDLFLSSTSVGVVENANNGAKLVANRNSTFHSMKLDVYNVTLEGGLAWSDVIDYYADKRNLLTNLELV